MNIDSLLFLFPKKTQSAVEIHCVFYLLAYMPFILPIGALVEACLKKHHFFTVLP
jgi:hypothetical protein